jgi:hypothetical protein
MPSAHVRGGRSPKRRGPRSCCCCCWETASIVVGMLSNYRFEGQFNIISRHLVTYAHALQQVLGVLVDGDGTLLRVVQSRNLGDVLILALTLLFLKLEGDTTDGTALDTLHQMGGEAGNLFWFFRVNWDCTRTRRTNRTLLRRRLEAMMAISSQMRLLVSKSSVSLG